MSVHAGRRYLITGGSSGIGAYVAARLAAEGARVWVTGTSSASIDRALAAGDDWSAGIGDGTAPVGGSIVDLAIPAQIRAAFIDAVSALGGLDGVFANGGIDGQGLSAENLDPEFTARVLQVNTVGQLVTLQESYKHLQRPGLVVVNASVNALRPEKHFADYNASKAAALAIAQTCAIDWGDQNLSVMTICPGYIPSRMTSVFLDDPDVAPELLADIPSGRFGRPDEVASLVAYLLSGEAMYLNGTVVPIAGGRNV